eukprot:TRINITY_DN111996_c0_g1_i1.p1 TRINITY_DN111996_c0_g1~~TRINITY_DN111996_c0_g1_i1.p1  ORF type:complete len:185 (-),score=33.10 TRINITY_DN111996_c0_g1_i1:153-707(-)
MAAVHPHLRDIDVDQDFSAHIAMAMQAAGVNPAAMHYQAPLPPVAEPPQEQVQAWGEETDYSEKYCDDIYEYRRVTVPRAMLQTLPQGRCMAESEWRAHGITMSRGWQHYDHHAPEANVLLFRRVLGTCPRTGAIPPAMAAKVEARDRYVREVEEARQRMMAEHTDRSFLAHLGGNVDDEDFRL